MALTNIEAQKKLETYQALLDIAGSIKELAARPDFKELSKLAYSLPENDRKKADEGRAIIAELDAKIAEQRKNAADQKAEQDNIDLRAEQLAKAQNKIIADAKKIQERQEEVAKREKAAEAKDKTLAERDAELKAKEAKLVEREVALGKDVAKFEAEKEESRKKAEEIKRLSEGL